ncbi:MAG: hypothetical protein IT426_12035 [Pirellulales bacterium]|nr:hypothetical protein [Pirellulales bacterium]
MKIPHFIPIVLLLAGLGRAGEPSLQLLAAEAEPAAKITAPAKAQVGFPVQLQTEGSVGKALKWIVFPAEPDAVFLAVVTEDGQRVGLFVSPKPGTFYFALVAASGEKIAVAKHTLVVEGPRPNPDPAPQPVPPPPVGKLWTVIVAESGQLTPAQGKLVASKAVADYLRAKGFPKAWMIDKDVLDENDRQPPTLAEYIARAKSLPYLFLVSDAGAVLHEGSLPESEEALLQLLKKFGG